MNEAEPISLPRPGYPPMCPPALPPYIYGDTYTFIQTQEGWTIKCEHLK